MKKTAKIIGIIFALLTALSLFLPVYKTTFTDGESMTIIFRGFDLYEFSAWGVVTSLIPMLLTGIMFTKFSDKAKSAMVMGTFILGNISVQLANTAMRDWIYAEATGTVHHFDGLILYVACLLCASVFCYIHCIKSVDTPHRPCIEDFRKYLDTEDISIDSFDFSDKEYLLYNKPCKILRTEVGEEFEEHDAHVLFATPEGYYITNSCTDYKSETDVGGEIAGFFYKNTPAGNVNIFYEDVDLAPFEKVKLMSDCDITEGEARLICDGNRKAVSLSLDNGMIVAAVCDDSADANKMCGGVIVQNGKLAAVVKAYDEAEKYFICENAEKYARELNKVFCEHEIFGISGGFEEFVKKSKNMV